MLLRRVAAGREGRALTEASESPPRPDSPTRPTLPCRDDLLDDDGLVDLDNMRAAVDALIARKPHLAARRPRGDIGQGARPESDDIGLATLLRRGA